MSWTTYVLQASLFNGLFAACITWAGVRFGMTLPIAALFGVVAGLIAYPPIGAPFADNHAAIFCSILILVVLLGIRTPPVAACGGCLRHHLPFSRSFQSNRRPFSLWRSAPSPSSAQPGSSVECAI